MQLRGAVTCQSGVAGASARLGFTAMNFLPHGPSQAEQVQRLAAEVLPLVREPVRQ